MYYVNLTIYIHILIISFIISTNIFYSKLILSVVLPMSINPNLFVFKDNGSRDGKKITLNHIHNTPVMIDLFTKIMDNVQKRKWNIFVG